MITLPICVTFTNTWWRRRRPSMLPCLIDALWSTESYSADFLLSIVKHDNMRAHKFVAEDSCSIATPLLFHRWSLNRLDCQWKAYHVWSHFRLSCRSMPVLNQQPSIPCQRATYFQSLLIDMFCSESFFMTLDTAISKSS